MIIGAVPKVEVPALQMLLNSQCGAGVVLGDIDRFGGHAELQPA